MTQGILPVSYTHLDVYKRQPQQIWDEGSRYIDNILEVYRDELRDKGVVDGPILEAAIAEYRQQYMQLLSSDHANETFHLYDHDVPNFKELATQLNEKDLRHIETELLSLIHIWIAL